MHPVSINCTSVSTDCLVENTIYGYRPNLPVNSFFIAFFAIAAIYHLSQAIRYRAWFFGLALTIGCISEAIGYGGRAMMHQNPFDSTAFSMQISCLIFAPAFIAAGVYVTLSHIVHTFGVATSRLPARYYTWLFVSCDFVSLMLQAIGGGFAGSAKGDKDKRDLGTALMMAGIVFQVATLVVFAALVSDYIVRTRKHWDAVNSDAKVLAGWRSFQLFTAAVAVAFFTIFFRCVYRIAELAKGWASPIMRDEWSYVVLEGIMIVAAVISLSVFHPGYCFPVMFKKSVPDEKSIESFGDDMTAASV